MYIYVTVSLYLCIDMLRCACIFHVNRLDLCIFTGHYTYLPKIHIYRNIHKGDRTLRLWANPLLSKNSEKMHTDVFFDIEQHFNRHQSYSAYG